MRRSVSGRSGAKRYDAFSWEREPLASVVEHMQLRRFVGLVDIGIASVLLVAIILPAREMYATSAQKAPDDQQFALALAEARTLAHPDDGAAVDELSRQLGAAGFKDWALDTALAGSERTRQSASRWRALLAASVAFGDRNDAVPALDYANRALSACDDHPAACPAYEQIRMKQYQQQLDAGVAAGIDPRLGPDAVRAFRRAGERALRQIHLGGREAEPAAQPTPGGTVRNNPP